MSHSSRYWVGFAAILFSACGGNGSSAKGAGGATGSGGAVSSGGATSAGGMVSSSGGVTAGSGGVIGPRCEGDHWVSSAMDVAKVDSCGVIGGNLSVTGNQLLEVTLTKLTGIEGFLTVWGNPALAQVSFPAIEEIGGYLDVSSNAQLASLSMPALRTVNQRRLSKPQDVLFSDNPLLDCQAEALAAQLRAKGFTGSIRIEPENLACSH